MTTLLTFLNSQMIYLYVMVPNKLVMVPMIQQRCDWVEQIKDEVMVPLRNFVGLATWSGRIVFVAILAVLVLGAVFSDKHRGKLIGGAALLVLVSIFLTSGINPVSSKC